MAKKKELLSTDLPGVRNVRRWKTKDKDAVVTNYTIGSQQVCEIDYDETVVVEADDSRSAPQQKRIGKTERVQMIKDLLKAKKSREEIKQSLYAQDIYKGNPNPASAFAGDWKAANE